MAEKINPDNSSLPEATTGTGEKPDVAQDYDKLVEAVTEQVWRLWREALRIDRQRRGIRTRS